MADRAVKVTFRADTSDLESKMKQAGKSVSSLADSGKDVSKGLDQATVSAAAMAAAHDKVGSTFLKVGAVGAASFAGIIKTSVSFEQAMSGVQAATMASAEEMKLLHDAALQAGKDTAYSATEAAAGIEELAKAGVSTSDILNGGLTGALSLAAAGGIEVGQAAETAASAMVQFGLAGSDVEHVADLLAAGAGKAQGGVTELSYALNQSGLVASAAGLSIEETVGTLSAFASAGLMGSDAGTSFKSMLQHLQNPANKAAELMDELGISLYDANGNIVGMANLAGQLQSALGGMTSAERDAAMATIFGSDAVRAANVLYKQGEEGIRNWSSAVDETGYAQKQAAARMDNLAGAWEEFTGSLETLGIVAGEVLLPALTSIVNGATNVLNAFLELPAPVSGTIVALGSTALVAVGAVGAFMKITKSIQETKAAFETLRASEGIIGSLSGKIADLGSAASSKGLGALRAAFGALASPIGLAATAVTGFALALAGMHDSYVKTTEAEVDALAASFDKVSGAATDATRTAIAESDRFVQMVAPKYEQIIADMEQMYLAEGKSADEAKRLAGSSSDLIDYLMGVGTGAERVATNLEKSNVAFNEENTYAELVTIGLGKLSEEFDLASQKAKAHAEAIDDTGQKEQEAAEASEMLAQAFNEQDNAADESADANAKVAESFDEAGDAADSAADDLSGYIDQLRAASEAYMSSIEAEWKYQDAIKEATNLLNDAKYAEADLEGQQRMREEALHDVTKAGWNAIEAMQREGASAKDVAARHVRLVNDLISTAQQLGMNADEAVAYASDLKLIPSNLRTLADFEKWKAEGAASVYTKKVKDVPKTWTTWLNAYTDQAKVDSYKASINGIPVNKTTTLTTVYREVRQIEQAGGVVAGVSWHGGSTFASGGYTGDGGKFEPAGIVHKGEYVIPADRVRAYGVSFLDQLVAQAPTGYAAGGFVHAASHPTMVNVNPAPVSLDGLAITGKLDIGGQLVDLIDGRIVRADKLAKGARR